jgi:NTP pyrophosphatase (non-canonical NTP hydrolase)
MCRTCNDGTLSVALKQLSDEIYEINCAKGWEPDKKRTFGDECALLHSEISEALEAFRDHGFADATGEMLHFRDCVDQGNYVHSCEAPLAKPEGVGSEFADLFIRLLHYSRAHDIDLMAETRRKIEYNRTRPFRHGGRAL